MGVIGEITREYLESLKFIKEIKRELTLPDIATDIIAIIGARRVGKTFLMLQKAREIASRGEQVVYVSMDEPRFKEIEARKFAELIREEYPKGKVYLFLDEVQEWKNWDYNLRWMHDVKDFQIYISGSSSTLQSSEIPSRLRGRYVSLALLPLSFREVASSIGSFETFRERGIVRRLLEDYVKWGGFPEVWLTRSREKIVSIIESVFYRDIVERQRLRSVSEFKEAFYYVLSQYANQLTWNSLKRLLADEGLKLDTKTVIKYVNAMQQAFLIFTVRRFSYSEREKAVAPKKIYIVDPAIATLFEQPLEIGRRLENIVFLQLLRKAGSPEKISYYVTRSGKEIDFILREPSGSTSLIECTFKCTSEHIKKVEQACSELKCSQAKIIALEAEESIQQKVQDKIRVVPLWKFLIEDS